MMKKLLLLALIAVAREATAADMPLRLTNVHFPRKSGHEVRQSEKTIQWTAALRQCP
jgi:hypothetical protein